MYRLMTKGRQWLWVQPRLYLQFGYFLIMNCNVMYLTYMCNHTLGENSISLQMNIL